MSFKVDDLVAIKIHKADKVSNLHATCSLLKYWRLIPQLIMLKW